MGQKLAAFDASGLLAGFYDTEDSPLPAGTAGVQITSALWQSLLAAQGVGKVIRRGSAGLPEAVDPSTVMTLPQAQAAQIAKMVAAYQGAIAQDVSVTTAAGVTKLFQADANSVANAQAMLAAYKTAVPAGFYWVAKDNTQVPFTLADLQGLAKAMGDQGWSQFQNLQNRKASILAATSVAAVQAVTW